MQVKKFVSHHKSELLVLLFLFFGFLIRILWQPGLPYGFHRDEAGIVYSAYSIVKTGRDEWGRLLPLHFKALGDFPPGIYNYLVALTIPFAGLSEIAERLPAIIFGSFLIPLSYVFVRRIFQNEKAAVLTALLVSISPWDVVQSRAGSEAIVALVFSLLGLLCYQLLIEKKKNKYWWLMGLNYFLALYSYNATRLALPLLHGLFTWYWWPSISLKTKKIHQVFAVVLLVFAVGSVVITPGRRMSVINTSFISHGQSPESLRVQFDREGGMDVPIVISRIYTNKVVNVGTTLVRQYFDYFSYGFLFDDAGFHKRYLVPKVGQLLLITLPFILIGIRFNKLKKRQFWLLVMWIFLAPLPGVITVTDVPNLKRAMYEYLPLLIFAAIGLQQFVSWFKPKWLKGLVVFGLLTGFLWNVGLFAKQYIVHTKFETVHHRSYGYDQVFAYTEQHKAEYDRIVIFESVDTPHTYYLFFTKYSPQKYQEIPAENKRDLFNPVKKVVQIEEYDFDPAGCPQPQDIKENILYVMPYGCLNEDNISKQLLRKKVVFGPDTQPIFVLAEKNSK